MSQFHIINADVIEGLRQLPDNHFHCCVTSPPYFGLRDYGCEGQIGLEPTLDDYVAKMVEVFREVRRVLRPDGVCWLNIGDSYTGSASTGGVRKETAYTGDRSLAPFRGKGLKPKDLMMVPARVAIALQADDWYLRSDIPWVKRAAMPESVTDRPAKALEYIFLLTKSERYFFDMEAIKKVATGQQPRNKAHKYQGVSPGTGLRGHSPSLTGPQSSARNFRNADLWFESVKPPHGAVVVGDEIVGLDIHLAGYKEAHFATMPPKLVETCLLAGTSSEGCCAGCGAQWRRVMEKTSVVDDSAKGRSFDTGKTGVNGMGRVQPGQRFKKQSVGWESSCLCGEVIAPCRVLDPFAGSGTTLAVALRLGLEPTGIELNPKYCGLIRKRVEEVQQETPLFD